MRSTSYAAGLTLALMLGGAVAAQTLGAPPAATTPDSLAADAQTAAPAAPPPLQEGVIATVNDDIISSYDLQQQMLFLIATSGIKVTKENLPQVQQEALRNLIDQRLQAQEVRKIKDLKISDAEVDEEISGMAKENNLTKDQLLGALKAQGVSPATIREAQRTRIGFEELVGGKFGDHARVGADEVKQALARFTASMSKPQYLVGEIYLDYTTVGGEQEAINGANQLVDQLVKGAPFQAVARQFSNAPSAATGGDAGWLATGDIQPELLAALENMKPGQLSRPIPTKDGVWIVYLREKREGGGETMVSLKQAAIKVAPDASPDQVTAATKTLMDLKPKLTCDNIDKMSEGLPDVVASDLGESSVKDLAPEFQNAATTLQAGQVSDPIRTTVGLHLIAVCGKHVAGAGIPTPEQIESRLRSQQLSMLARRYMRDLHAEAIIDVK